MFSPINCNECISKKNLETKKLKHSKCSVIHVRGDLECADLRVNDEKCMRKTVLHTFVTLFTKVAKKIIISMKGV